MTGKVLKRALRERYADLGAYVGQAGRRLATDPDQGRRGARAATG